MLFGRPGLREAVRDLQEKVRELESAQKQLELEWSDTYDKVRSILGKIAKRAAAAAEHAESESSPATSTDGGVPGAGQLSLDPMSARIRASRRSSA